MELEKKVASIEGMVANLIVDQQGMVKSLNARGDRHSGSLNCYTDELTALRRENDWLQANLSMVVDECTTLRTQVESMGDNICR